MKKWYKENRMNIFLSAVITSIMIGACFDEPIPTATTEPTEEAVIQWKQEELQTESAEVTVEPLETSATVEPVGEVTFYDVPLSEELQIHISEECEKYNISPSIVIAMIERESSYKADAIGDNGNSLGLMQIQPRWNQERMSRLGCTDLLDPFQNVTVGIDIVAELIEEDSDLYWVLMAYNGGQAYATKNMNSGNISDYAIEVVERASELEKVVE